MNRVLVLVVSLTGPVVVLDGMRAALFDPLPFHEPENLVSVGGVAQPRAGDYLDLLGESSTLTSATVTRYGRATWRYPGGSRRLDVLAGDRSTLNVLGLSPVRGRPFSRHDMEDAQSVLVSPDFWQRDLDNGHGFQALEINGRIHQVVGVAPPALLRLGQFDVFLPRPSGRSYDLRLGDASGSQWGGVIGRRKPGASLPDVRADMERLQRSQEGGRMGRSQVRVSDLRTALTTPAIPTLKTLGLAALVLLLLAAVTTGMLAAMEAAERADELAVRIALGATPRRLRWEAARPWIAATVPAVGIALAAAIPLSRLVRTAVPQMAQMDQTSSTIALMTVVLGLFLAVVAALCTFIPQAVANLSDRGLGSPSSARGVARASRYLATGQVALSVALFCGAIVAARGLLDQSLRGLGFVADGVQVIEVEQGEDRKPERRGEGWSRLMAEASPDHRQMTLGSALPWESTSSLWMGSPTNEEGFTVGVTRVGSGFFSLLGIRFLEGADPFSAGTATADIVISEDTARRLGVRAGSTITVDSDLRRVAGVVASAFDPRDRPGSVWPRAYLMMGAERFQESSATVLVRGSPREASRLRAVIEASLPWATVSSPSPLAGRLAGRLQQERVGTMVLVGYASVACLLVILGLQGLMRRRLSQKISEVGIRLALGASRRQIDMTMLSALVAPAVLGLALGALLGLNLSQAIAALMSWARPLDPGVYAAGLLGGLLIVLLSAAPALRIASRARPADLLRHS